MKALDIAMHWWPLAPSTRWDNRPLLVHIASAAPFEKKKIVKWLERTISREDYQIQRPFVSSELNELVEYKSPSFTVAFVRMEDRVAFEALLRRFPVRAYNFVLPFGLDKDVQSALQKARGIKDAVWTIPAVDRRDGSPRKILSMRRNQHSNMAVALMRLKRII